MTPELLIHISALGQDKNVGEIPPIPGTFLICKREIEIHPCEEPRAESAQRIIPECRGISGGKDPLSESWAMTTQCPYTHIYLDIKYPSPVQGRD